MTEKEKFPIGRFKRPEQISQDDIQTWIEEIAALPAQMKAAVANWTDEQFDTPYRDGGWTVRQLIHHVADSHLNSYIRFKWTLTEDSPTIKAYDQEAWAEEIEAKTAPADLSLNLLDALHQRWVLVLRNLSETDLQRYFIHPETGNQVPLAVNVGLYAWHSKHHLGHILQLKEKMAW